MSTLNGSTYRKTVSRSVYSDSLLPERRNGFPSTPQPPMSYLEPPPRAPSRARTPTEVAAVDPTLEDAQKAGNNYHITMSLNAALAEAGLPSNVAMATGRRSQMEYATNSRAQSEYATNSQRSSRLGFVPQMAQPRTNERPGSVSVVRVTGDDVMRVTGNDVMRVTGNDGVRVTGNDVVAHAHFSFPVTQPRDDHVIVNEAYTIKSVQPSSVTHTETLTTVERPKSRVGFDLELFGGQTTVVTETTSSASDQQNNSGRNNGGSVATLTKSQRSSTNIASLPKATPRASTNSGAVPQPTPRVTSHIGALSKATPRPSSNGDNWNSTSEWTEVREDTNHKRSGQHQKKAKPDHNRQFWNPGDSTKHISESQVTETRMQRPSGVGSGVKGSRSDEYGAMSGSGDAVDGYESIEYETVRDNPWMIREMEGGEDEDESLIIYRGLAKGADASTVRQEVIYGEKEMEIVRQKNGRIQQDLLNVDIVSENVTVVVGNNLAQMSIMVRTERIVPIDDSKELFQKSSVTVTRLIEVDMMATPERERIYNQVLHSQKGGRGLTLSQKQTFDLYKAFLRLTETDSGHALHEQVRIDKETDQARLTDLDLKRDYNIDLDPVSTSSRRHTGYSRGFPN